MKCRDQNSHVRMKTYRRQKALKNARRTTKHGFSGLFFFRIFEIIIFWFVIAVLTLVHDANAVFHSYFRNDFHMLSAVNIGHE